MLSLQQCNEFCQLESKTSAKMRDQRRKPTASARLRPQRAAGLSALAGPESALASCRRCFQPSLPTIIVNGDLKAPVLVLQIATSQPR
ncbi:hypothetical protein D3C78_1594160 [compost metagenome]